MQRALRSKLLLRCRKVRLGCNLRLLQWHLKAFGLCFAPLLTASRSIEINREFVPVIREAMGNVYRACVNESGPGSFMRMKCAMGSHLQGQRLVMFDRSCQAVESLLRGVMVKAEETLSNKTDEIYTTVRGDYCGAMGGGEVAPGEAVPKWQREMREELRTVIGRADDVFHEVPGVPEELQLMSGQPQTATIKDEPMVDTPLVGNAMNDESVVKSEAGDESRPIDADVDSSQNSEEAGSAASGVDEELVSNPDDSAEEGASEKGFVISPDASDADYADKKHLL